ncbi:MAG: glutamine amidotransferase [Gammaproteobacteria bacterium]|nr:glutamine amidotransferase [Gammaproteobacteria bacterium]
MKTAVVIRHVAYNGLGLFNRVLELAGYDVIYMDAGVADFSRRITIEADIMVVLDGPVSINEMAKYPYLVNELQLVEYRLQNNLPVFGIGLGAEIMAKALGASVYPMHEKECGWQEVLLRTGNSLLEPLRGRQLLHWHNESFALPDNAQLLASTAKCEVQAFSYERSLALQFHMEIEMKKIEQWILGHAIEIQNQGSHCLNYLREGAENNGALLEERARLVMQNWLQTLDSSD